MFGTRRVNKSSSAHQFSADTTADKERDLGLPRTLRVKNLNGHTGIVERDSPVECLFKTIRSADLRKHAVTQGDHIGSRISDISCHGGLERNDIHEVSVSCERPSSVRMADWFGRTQSNPADSRRQVRFRYRARSIPDPENRRRGRVLSTCCRLVFPPAEKHRRQSCLFSVGVS